MTPPPPHPWACMVIQSNITIFIHFLLIDPTYKILKLYNNNTIITTITKHIYHSTPPLILAIWWEHFKCLSNITIEFSTTDSNSCPDILEECYDSFDCKSLSGPPAKKRKISAVPSDRNAKIPTDFSLLLTSPSSVKVFKTNSQKFPKPEPCYSSFLMTRPSRK